jgi:MOSC domain-containing protein YiiM
MAAIIESIYISPKSAAPMVSLQTANLIPGVGVENDRYALNTGTYSARFFGEPGKNLTMVSADAVESAIAEHGMEPLASMGDLRRNLVVRGLSADAINGMVGHEVCVGPEVRLFVHRRTVPCKKSEAGCKRAGLTNNLWYACGVNCEILTPGAVSVGDEVGVASDAGHQPERANPGRKPPAFFVRPSERTAEQARSMVIPPAIAAIMCLVDPTGFKRVEEGYNSVGQHFWSRRANAAGALAAALRAPLLFAAAAMLVAVVTTKIRQ